MKLLSSLLIGALLSVAAADVCLGQTRLVANVTASDVKVLEMKSVPDGYFLVNLQNDGRDRLLNIQVKDNTAKCVNSDDARLKGLEGKFQLIGNGVFVIHFQNANHRCSQYWLFRSDGSAVPVKDESIAPPKKA